MKISQKDLDLLVESMMNEVYDYDYVHKQQEKEADKALADFKKTKVYKNFKELFEKNPTVHYISIKDSTFDWTPAESAAKTWYTISLYTFADLERTFKNRVMNKIKIEYPDSCTVRNKIRTVLTIELIWGNDLKKALAEVTKTIKKEFKLS